MAVTRHEDIELVAGDDWAIPFALLDPTGSPLDLTDVQFIWALVGPDGYGVVAAEQNATITPDQPLTAGTGTIFVPRSVTEGLVIDRHWDSLRVIVGGMAATMWEGMILVAADPDSV